MPLDKQRNKPESRLPWPERFGRGGLSHWSEILDGHPCHYAYNSASSPTSLGGGSYFVHVYAYKRVFVTQIEAHRIAETPFALRDFLRETARQMIRTANQQLRGFRGPVTIDAETVEEKKPFTFADLVQGAEEAHSDARNEEDGDEDSDDDSDDDSWANE